MASQGTGAPVPESGRRISATRIRIARVIAVAADALQLGLFPMFGVGALSILNDGLDVAVGIVLVFLVGWHFAFLPSFVAELIPGLDLIPTWTVAVWLATRHGADGRALPGPPGGALPK
jgi:hypothetical protein